MYLEHSKGPWKPCKTAGLPDAVMSSDNRPVCILGALDIPPVERASNKALILSAPELRAALFDAYLYCHNAPKSPDTEAVAALLKPAVEFYRATLDLVAETVSEY